MSRQTRKWRTLARLGLFALLAALALATSYMPSAAAPSAPLEELAPAQTDVGYPGIIYGSSANSTPTGEKPESKLWWNDGRWWGAMFSQDAGGYRAFWLNLSNQTWIDSGTALGNRNGDKVDVLWDQGSQKLYMVSHVFSTSASPTTSNWAQLFRYSYNSSTKTYSLDAGFPVNVSRGRAEAVVVEKDSTGRLWVTYVESGKVMINHSLNDDLTWGTPFQLPGSGTVNSDDISSVIAFGGNKIGVVWSNQNTDAYYLAIHNDGAPPNAWTIETGIQGNNLVDDHINLATDSAGRIYLAGKTSLTGDNPLVVLDVRGPNGGWSRYVYGMDVDGHTRPIVVTDTQNQKIYMFATSPESSGAIYMKSADMSNIQFPVGKGQPFISSSTSPSINNATSTKQSLNNTTGLVVLASNSSQRRYYHNYMPLGGGGGTPTPTPTTTTPTPTPTTVTPTPTTTTPTPTPTTTTPTPTPTTTTPTPTQPPGAQLVFSPAHDTHVKSDRPTSTYGSDSYVRVRLSGDVDYDSYFKFNVTGTGGSVQSATLRLYSYDGGPDGGTLYTTSNNYRNSSTPWTESGLTWNNAPGVGTPLYSVGVVPDNSWAAWDVTSVITGDGTYSFALSNFNSNSVFYYSKEAASFRPELVVVTGSGGSTSTPTPTPTTVTPTPTTVTPTPTTTTPTPTPTTTTPTPTQPPGTIVTVQPAHDTHVKSDRPTSTYGSDSYVRVRLSGDVDYDSYFKFNVTGTGGQVTRAILWMYSYDGGPDGGTLYTTSNNYRNSSTPWTESGLTWNNAPGVGTPLYSVGVVPDNSWAAWDVTSVITGDGTYSFALSNFNSNSVFYYSKEAASFKPYLALEIGGTMGATAFTETEIAGMRAALAEPLGTPEPTLEITDEPTATPQPTVVVTDEPTPTPLPTIFSLPYADDFTSGAGWSASGMWQHDALAGRGSGGWFANSAVRGLESTLQLNGLIDLTSVLTPRLTFWQKAALTAGDRVAVDISLDGGLSWLALADTAGAVSDWTQYTVDLSAYAGQLIALRFRLDTTGELPVGTASIGLWLDDVAVNVEIPAPPTDPAAEPTDEPTDVPTSEPQPTEPAETDEPEVTATPTVEPTLPVETPTGEVTPPASTLLTVESDDPAVLASGDWTAHDTAAASGGRYVYSSGSLSDSLTLAFTGTQVEVVFVLHPALGSFAVEVDGALLQVVSSTASDTIFGARTSITGLSAGAHVLRIVPTEGTIAIDAFAVEGLAPLPAQPPVEPTLEPTAEPTLEPEEPAPTETPWEITPTSTPLPLLLPVYDSFEAEQTWLADGSWTHALNGGYSGSGWYASGATPGASTLTYVYQIDLRAAQNPQLSFWQTANLAGDDIVSLEVSLDGGLTWLAVDVQRGWSGGWAPRTVDLSGFRGAVIGVRFSLLMGPSGQKGNRPSGLGIDELIVQEVILPTATPLPTLPPTEPPAEVLPTPEPTQAPTEPPGEVPDGTAGEESGETVTGW